MESTNALAHSTFTSPDPLGAFLASTRLTQTDILDDFLDRVGAVGCSFKPRPNEGENGSPATFIPFTFLYPLYNGNTTYTNTIYVTSNVTRSAAEEAISNVHEGSHALQWARSPALHASICNPASPYVMSPADHVLTTLLTEIEAYANQAYVSWIKEKTEASYRAASKKGPISVCEVESELARGRSIEDSLARLAVGVLQKPRLLAADGACVDTYMQYYANFALNIYRDSLRMKNQYPAHFVQLGQGDYLSMGSQYLPGLMPAILERLAKTQLDYGPEAYRSLREIEGQNGIGQGGANLPYFQDSVRRELGMCPQEFLMNSRQSRRMQIPSIDPGQDRRLAA